MLVRFQKLTLFIWSAVERSILTLLVIFQQFVCVRQSLFALSSNVEKVLLFAKEKAILYGAPRLYKFFFSRLNTNGISILRINWKVGYSDDWNLASFERRIIVMKYFFLKKYWILITILIQWILFFLNDIWLFICRTKILYKCVLVYLFSEIVFKIEYLYI